jgi:Uma2 family endonuclease
MEAVAHRTGSGEVVIGPIDVHFSPHDLVQPDILYISDRQADQYKETHFAGAPAFVIEIISPYTSGFYERVRKTALYMSRGVEEYWVIDPEKQCILVFTSASSDTTSEIFTSGMLAANVLAGLTIDIPKLFAAADQPRKTEN